MEVKKLKPCYRDVSCRLVVLLVLLWTIICCNIKSRDSNCNNEHHSHILISTAEWRSTYWRFHQEGAKFLSVACAIEFFLMILIVSGQWILQNTICQLFFFMTSNDCLSVKTSIFSMCKAYLPKLFRSILQRFEWKDLLQVALKTWILICDLILIVGFFGVSMLVFWSMNSGFLKTKQR